MHAEEPGNDQLERHDQADQEGHDAPDRGRDDELADDRVVVREGLDAPASRSAWRSTRVSESHHA